MCREGPRVRAISRLLVLHSLGTVGPRGEKLLVLEEAALRRQLCAEHEAASVEALES